MGDGKTTILFKNASTRPSEDEWLGPESHMPNLNRELRRREPRRMGFSSGWIYLENRSEIAPAAVRSGAIQVALRVQDQA